MTINSVFFSLISIPYWSQKSFNTLIFCSHPSLVVDKITVSSISSSACNHPRKPSSGHCSFKSLTNLSVKRVNRKQLDGDPCLTPREINITAVPRANFVSAYKAAIAQAIVYPHPNLASILIKAYLEILSYALQKSTYVINNFTFLGLLHKA